MKNFLYGALPGAVLGSALLVLPVLAQEVLAQEVLAQEVLAQTFAFPVAAGSKVDTGVQINWVSLKDNWMAGRLKNTSGKVLRKVAFKFRLKPSFTSFEPGIVEEVIENDLKVGEERAWRKLVYSGNEYFELIELDILPAEVKK